MEPRIIRQDALGFDQSAIKIGVPGFSTEVTVYTTWFRDNGLKGPDPKAGQYPWIKISWPSSTSEPDSRKLIPFMETLALAALVQQYILRGLIRCATCAVMPVGNPPHGVPIVHWKVVRPALKTLWEDVPGYEDVPYEGAMAFALGANKDCNVGLKQLGGWTELELQWAAHIDRMADQQLAEGRAAGRIKPKGL